MSHWQLPRGSTWHQTRFTSTQPFPEGNWPEEDFALSRRPASLTANNLNALDAINATSEKDGRQSRNSDQTIELTRPFAPPTGSRVDRNYQGPSVHVAWGRPNSYTDQTNSFTDLQEPTSAPFAQDLPDPVSHGSRRFAFDGGSSSSDSVDYQGQRRSYARYHPWGYYPRVHWCSNCRRFRSRSFHDANPLLPGKQPIVGVCRRCERAKYIIASSPKQAFPECLARNKVPEAPKEESAPKDPESEKAHSESERAPSLKSTKEHADVSTTPSSSSRRGRIIHVIRRRYRSPIESENTRSHQSKEEKSPKEEASGSQQPATPSEHKLEKKPFRRSFTYVVRTRRVSSQEEGDGELERSHETFVERLYGDSSLVSSQPSQDDSFGEGWSDRRGGSMDEARTEYRMTGALPSKSSTKKTSVRYETDDDDAWRRSRVGYRSRRRASYESQFEEESSDDVAPSRVSRISARRVKDEAGRLAREAREAEEKAAEQAAKEKERQEAEQRAEEEAQRLSAMRAQRRREIQQRIAAHPNAYAHGRIVYQERSRTSDTRSRGDDSGPVKAAATAASHQPIADPDSRRTGSIRGRLQDNDTSWYHKSFARRRNSPLRSPSPPRRRPRPPYPEGRFGPPTPQPGKPGLDPRAYDPKALSLSKDESDLSPIRKVRNAYTRTFSGESQTRSDRDRRRDGTHQQNDNGSSSHRRVRFAADDLTRDRGRNEEEYRDSAEALRDGAELNRRKNKIYHEIEQGGPLDIDGAADVRPADPSLRECRKKASEEMLQDERETHLARAVRNPQDQ